MPSFTTELDQPGLDKHGRAPSCPWRKSESALRRAAWSPYTAGILIGLLQVPAFYFIGSALGASSSFVTVAAHIASVFDSSALDNAYFAKYADSAKYWWQLALVIGIALGAYFSSTLSGTRRTTISDVWKKAANIKSFSARAVMAFAGGFILLVGARIAGGCTSGHGISGMAQLAIGSFIAVAAMFAGGILVAMLMKRI